MQPCKALVVGCNDAEQSALRRELVGQAVPHEEFSDLASAMVGGYGVPDAKVMFLVKINSADDLPRIRHLIKTGPAVPVVALMNPDSDLAAVLSTMRAGACQVVMFPLKTDEFRQALETALLQFGNNARRTHVIAVSGVSEGCGASTIALNLAFEMAQRDDKKCVLLELAQRMGRLAGYFGVEPALTINDLEARREPPDLALVQQALTRITDHFSLLAGPYRTIDTRVKPLTQLPLLVDHLRQLAEVVVLDLPYTFDEAYFEALGLADQVVLVAALSVASIRGLTLVSETLTARKTHAARFLVINRFDPGDRDFSVSRLKGLLHPVRLFTVENDPVHLKAAANNGQTLRQYSPHARSLPDIDQLAVALLGEAHQPTRLERLGAWIKKLFIGQGALAESAGFVQEHEEAAPPNEQAVAPKALATSHS
ncbi:hypothetical protein AYO44_18285 [Planctomycetaceae bacterium SCGC AG-212-F19]|nr:hypothetical protein AYO44_18285 [Planctomycetaceae bacterium SCGC AG-212-F19]